MGTREGRGSLGERERGKEGVHMKRYDGKGRGKEGKQGEGEQGEGRAREEEKGDGGREGGGEVGGGMDDEGESKKI